MLFFLKYSSPNILDHRGQILLEGAVYSHVRPLRSQQMSLGPYFLAPERSRPHFLAPNGSPLKIDYHPKFRFLDLNACTLIAGIAVISCFLGGGVQKVVLILTIKWSSRRQNRTIFSAARAKRATCPRFLSLFRPKVGPYFLMSQLLNGRT